MKKYIAFLYTWLWVSMAAAECVGGTLITANSMTNNPYNNCTSETCNGVIFCKSNGYMNWWSAFTWCASNGLKLATFQDMCPGIPTSVNNVTGACPNLRGTGNQWVWSELGSDSGKAIVVNLSSGAVDASQRTSVLYGNGGVAFCR